VSTTLADVLDEARSAGFLGPGPVDAQIRHAEGFAAVARRLLDPDAGPASEGPGERPAAVRAQVLDLGSGGGLPGLVVAESWPEASVVLLEAQGRRAAFLGRAVEGLGLGDRVAVRQARAEDFGRDPAGRSRFDVVTARSFGPPAVVAECAAPLLRTGGWLVVSEPPDQSDAEAVLRWPAEPLARLGLRPGERLRAAFGYRVLRQAEPCPERFPRRNGVPAKRPLF
jgi:16S rRNA (guanine527-N7)-methyltransferase